jgi:cytochrome b561
MNEQIRTSESSMSLNHAEELQYREQIFSARQYSYEIVQKLTYFIVSAELVTCGYILLNADSLAGIKDLNYLFLICGIAAMAGILWRFFYNITYHNNTHGINDCAHKIAKKLQISIYYLYVVLTLLTFAWLLIRGYLYLTSLNIAP